MQPRVAYVSPIAPGSESQVREAHARFPEQVVAEVGAVSVSVFIGSDYYMLLFDIAHGDFQEVFARFAGHPQVRAFFDALGAYLREPLPMNAHPANGFHDNGPAHSAPGVTTARLPLVGEVFRWEGAVR